MSMTNTPRLGYEVLRDEARALAAANANDAASIRARRHRRDEIIRELKRDHSRTIPEIAELVGVSQGTVKAVLR